MAVSLTEIKLQLSNKHEVLFGGYTGENVSWNIQMPYFSEVDVKFWALNLVHQRYTPNYTRISKELTMTLLNILEWL